MVKKRRKQSVLRRLPKTEQHHEEGNFSGPTIRADSRRPCKLLLDPESSIRLLACSQRHPKDIPKTAFVTAGGGLYEYTRMPFGLCNAPATFQRLMNDLYKDVLYKSVIVFLGDVLTFSRSIEEHISLLRFTFQRLREANLKLKPKKCCLLQREVAYLGHIVDKEGPRPNPEKLAALELWPTPTTTTGVRSFIWFCSYYRKYIRGFAEIAKPLNALTKKSVKFTWKPEHADVFNRLRNELVRGHVLSFPDFSQPFIIVTDASNNSFGAVLSNVIDGEDGTLVFMGRVLSKTGTMYSTTKREALAVVQLLSWFRSYILGLKLSSGLTTPACVGCFGRTRMGLPSGWFKNCRNTTTPSFTTPELRLGTQTDWPDAKISEKIGKMVNLRRFGGSVESRSLTKKHWRKSGTC